MDSNESYSRRLFVTVGVVAFTVGLLLIIWHLAYVLLLIFGAGLFAIFIGGLASSLEHYLHLPRWAAAPLVTLTLFGLLGLGGYTLGPAIEDQFRQLTDRLPQAVERVKNSLADYSWGRSLVDWMRSQWQDAPMSPANIVGGLTGAFSTLFGTLSDMLLVIVIGFYLTLHPKIYTGGFLSLFPGSKRDRVKEVMQATAHALRWWLIGRGLSMLVVGGLTAMGLWLIEMPMALALAVFAGVLSFIPFLGPVAAAVPALLVGMASGPGQAVNVLIVYAGVQFLESNIITPFVQVRAVSLPPAVMLSGQLFMGVLFGLLGLLLATPLMVALIVQIQMLYVNDVLGGDVTPLGQ